MVPRKQDQRTLTGTELDIANQHERPCVTGSFVDAKYTAVRCRTAATSGSLMPTTRRQRSTAGRSWSGGGFHLSMSAMDTTLEETFASIGHTHDPDGELTPLWRRTGLT